MCSTCESDGNCIIQLVLLSTIRVSILHGVTVYKQKKSHDISLYKTKLKE
jgi:hypothetical protein